MEQVKFKKAEKTQSKLRAALFGPPGSGKTMTALRMASGMSLKVAVIDSEHGTASKYSDRFNFDVVNLKNKDIAEYSEVIRAAAEAGYEVLVIDSLSHAWQELIEDVEELAKRKYNGNSFRAWGEGTPKQRDFTEVILDFPGHVIVTMRSKIEYAVDKDERGKTTIEKKGLAPEQGKGIEYEFDLLMELNQAHLGHISKDRSGKYQDKDYDKPGEDLGKEMLVWLSEGKPAPVKEKTEDKPTPEAYEKLDLIKKCNAEKIVLPVAEMKALTLPEQINTMKQLLTLKQGAIEAGLKVDFDALNSKPVAERIAELTAAIAAVKPKVG
jgi:hypothetical protein